LLWLAGAPAFATEHTWNFSVYMDAKPIGYHRFVLRDEPDGQQMTSSARFDVRILGLTVYRYQLDATERWKGDCMLSLVSSSDANGQRVQVDTEPAGCQMSFAYWNPRILNQAQLINAQTGKAEAVSVAPMGDEQVPVRGRTVPARRYRISGPKHPIDIWYSPQGEWLALESVVGGGRHLRYRLEPEQEPAPR
jgi:hypothetical protein